MPLIWNRAKRFLSRCCISDASSSEDEVTNPHSGRELPELPFQSQYPSQDQHQHQDSSLPQASSSLHITFDEVLGSPLRLSTSPRPHIPGPVRIHRIDSQSSTSSHGNRTSPYTVPQATAKTGPVMPSRSKNKSRRPKVSPRANYGEYQWKGFQRRKWIEDPNFEDCPFQRSTLSFEDLKRKLEDLMIPRHVPLNFRSIGDPKSAEIISPAFEKCLIRHKLSTKHSLDNSTETPFVSWNIQVSFFSFMGTTGPGILEVSLMRRNPNEKYKKDPAPHISSALQAAYQHDFDIETLKYVLFTTVQNPDTEEFIKNQLYISRNHIAWPTRRQQRWLHGSDGYHGLLGTEVGRIVVALVLGAFERGTRYIADIVIWRGESDCADIEFSIKRFQGI